MKLTVAIIVAALAVLLGPVVWQFATYKPQSVPSSGLPWQIETLPGGEAQAVVPLRSGVGVLVHGVDIERIG